MIRSSTTMSRGQEAGRTSSGATRSTRIVIGSTSGARQVPTESERVCSVIGSAEHPIQEHKRITISMTREINDKEPTETTTRGSNSSTENVETRTRGATEGLSILGHAGCVNSLERLDDGSVEDNYTVRINSSDRKNQDDSDMEGIEELATAKDGGNDGDLVGCASPIGSAKIVLLSPSNLLNCNTDPGNILNQNPSSLKEIHASHEGANELGAAPSFPGLGLAPRYASRLHAPDESSPVMALPSTEASLPLHSSFENANDHNLTPNTKEKRIQATTQPQHSVAPEHASSDCLTGFDSLALSSTSRSTVASDDHAVTHIGPVSTLSAQTSSMSTDASPFTSKIETLPGSQPSHATTGPKQDAPSVAAVSLLANGTPTNASNLVAASPALLAAQQAMAIKTTNSPSSVAFDPNTLLQLSLFPHLFNPYGHPSLAHNHAALLVAAQAQTQAAQLLGLTNASPQLPMPSATAVSSMASNAPNTSSNMSTITGSVPSTNNQTSSTSSDQSQPSSTKSSNSVSDASTRLQTPQSNMSSISPTSTIQGEASASATNPDTNPPAIKIRGPGGSQQPIQNLATSALPAGFPLQMAASSPYLNPALSNAMLNPAGLAYQNALLEAALESATSSAHLFGANPHVVANPHQLAMMQAAALAGMPGMLPGSSNFHPYGHPMLAFQPESLLGVKTDPTGPFFANPSHLYQQSPSSKHGHSHSNDGGHHHSKHGRSRHSSSSAHSSPVSSRSTTSSSPHHLGPSPIPRSSSHHALIPPAPTSTSSHHLTPNRSPHSRPSSSPQPSQHGHHHHASTPSSSDHDNDSYNRSPIHLHTSNTVSPNSGTSSTANSGSTRSTGIEFAGNTNDYQRESGGASSPSSSGANAFIFRNKGAVVSMAELLDAADGKAPQGDQHQGQNQNPHSQRQNAPSKSSSTTSPQTTSSTASPATAAVAAAAANGTVVQTSSHATRISSLADEGLSWDDSLCDMSGRLPAGALDNPSVEDWFHSWQLNRRVTAKWLAAADADVAAFLFDISKYYACNFEGSLLDFLAPVVPTKAVLNSFLAMLNDHSRNSIEPDPSLVHVATSYFNCSSRKRAAPECGAKLNTQLWFDLRTQEFFESVEGAKKTNAKNLHSAACRACHKSRLPPSVTTLRIVDRLLTAGIAPSAVEEMVKNMAMEKCGGVIDDGRFVATAGTIFNRQRKVRTEQSRHLISPHQTRFTARKSGEERSSPTERALPSLRSRTRGQLAASQQSVNMAATSRDDNAMDVDDAPRATTRRVSALSRSPSRTDQPPSSSNTQQDANELTESDEESEAMEGLRKIMGQRDSSSLSSSAEEPSVEEAYDDDDDYVDTRRSVSSRTRAASAEGTDQKSTRGSKASSSTVSSNTRSGQSHDTKSRKRSSTSAHDDAPETKRPRRF